MLFQAIIIAASAAFSSAQVVYNQTTGQFICPANNPNGDFCAGASLSTNIIIRCTNGIGQPGNCDDNLDGDPPVGLNYAPCWQTSNSSGDAACSKNCIVYNNNPFTLPNCTPSYTASSSSVSSTSTASSSPSTSVSSSTTTSTGTTTRTTGSTTVTETFTTTYCPGSTSTSSTLTTTYVPPTGTGSPAPPSNGTTTAPGSGSSPSKSPVGPTTTGPSSPGFTGAASSFNPAVGGTLAGLGLIIAYFL